LPFSRRYSSIQVKKENVSGIRLKREAAESSPKP